MNTREKFLQRFGRRIRAARILKGLTLQACARQAGMSYSNLSMIERGHRSMYAESIPALAKVLGVSVEYLIVGDGTQDDDEDEHAA